VGLQVPDDESNGYTGRKDSKMKVKQIAEKMLDKNSKERKIAEKMFGIKFEEMTPEQRVLAAECISAFNIQLVEE